MDQTFPFLDSLSAIDYLQAAACFLLLLLSAASIVWFAPFRSNLEQAQRTALERLKGAGDLELSATMHLANAENGPTDSGRDRPEIEESRFCVPELMEFEASLEARLGGEQISRLTGIVSVATRDVRFRTFSGPSGPRLGRSQRS